MQPAERIPIKKSVGSEAHRLVGAAIDCRFSHHGNAVSDVEIGRCQARGLGRK
jgi:hypothetical protein